jgi:putative flippase GtrA
MIAQVFRFGLIGVLATLLHMVVGATAFVIAFVVSFMGHFGYSFPDRTADPRRALIRFAAVACGGFAVNETMLAVLIGSDLVAQIPALVLATGTSAVLTYFASRNWAFRGRATATPSGGDAIGS